MIRYGICRLALSGSSVAERRTLRRGWEQSHRPPIAEIELRVRRPIGVDGPLRIPEESIKLFRKQVDGRLPGSEFERDFMVELANALAFLGVRRVHLRDLRDVSLAGAFQLVSRHLQWGQRLASCGKVRLPGGALRDQGLVRVSKCVVRQLAVLGGLQSL